jgi:hypothetical protein
MIVGRKVYPDDAQGFCDFELYQSISCAFSAQMYSKYLKDYYGVKSGIPDEHSKYLIKKTLLDLNSIDDPDFCKPIPCPCACNVRVSIIVSTALNCSAPTNVTTSYLYIPVQCGPVLNISTSLSYQS